MNALAQELLGVAKRYLGPAAQPFLSTQLHALGVNANTVSAEHLAALAARAEVSAARAMGDARAAELSAALAACAESPVKQKHSGHALASDAAAKLLASGRLRQAEISYRQLAEKHGDVESYRGLARVQTSLGDEAAALETLRQAAAALARRGDRAGAIGLLASAVALSPLDLSAHRRMAAALANQGDLDGAVEEYARFVDAALAGRDTRRAWLELAYGRETLGELPGLLRVADQIAAASGGSASTPAASRPTVEKRLLVPPWAQPDAATTPASDRGAPARAAARSPSRSGTRADSSDTAFVHTGARTLTLAVQADLQGPVNLLERTGLRAKNVSAAPTPKRPPLSLEAQLAELLAAGEGADSVEVAASRAAILIGARDPRATAAALDVARRLLSMRRLESASDVLLDYIGHGFNDREAQRLLIEVDCALGRRDVAREKCQLLGHAYRLDGAADVAADVETLARIL